MSIRAARHRRGRQTPAAAVLVDELEAFSDDEVLYLLVPPIPPRCLDRDPGRQPAPPGQVLQRASRLRHGEQPDGEGDPERRPATILARLDGALRAALDL